jgi:hypothetical protein
MIPNVTKLRFIVFTILTLYFINNLLAQTATAPSGSGTSNDPYQIATINNLYWITQDTSRWSKNYIQTANIDAAASSTWNSDSGWTPIGNVTKQFTGSYNGKGHTISHLYCNRPATSTIGLFGYVVKATLDSVGLLDVSIVGDQFVGGLAGRNYSSSTISNSYATGNISGSANVGGLVGSNSSSSTISNSYTTGSVSGSSYIGGLAGGNSSIISNSYAAVSISGSSMYAGGLVGSNNSSSTISNCYATGNVSGHNDVGGLAGRSYSSSTISNSYATGSVSGLTYTAGLIGYCSSDTVRHCYWNMETTGWKTGFGAPSGIYTDTIGLTTAQMKNASNYTNWDFTNKWNINSGNSYPGLRTVSNNVPFTFGGSVSIDSTIALTNVYNGYDLETGTSALAFKVVKIYGTGSIDVSGIFHIDQFSARDSLLYQVGEVLASGDTLWGNTAKVAFVNLQFLTGNGTEASPYLISTYSDLKKIKGGLTSVYRLTANIDASESATENSGAGFEPIGNSFTQFSGTFHGDGYVIKHLYINRPTTSYVGLFGFTSNATIDSVGLFNAAITGGDYCVGSLVGYNASSTINNCFATGTISDSSSYTGGLVGYNSFSTIRNSYASVCISGSGGGLVGYNNYGSTISNSYAAGSISGSGGGLAGTNQSSTVSKCYASVNVSASGYGLIGTSITDTVQRCYWNTETTPIGFGTTSGVHTDNTGLTTAQMKLAANFNGWDFTNTWNISAGNSYPGLRTICNNIPCAFPNNLSIDSTIMLSSLYSGYDLEKGVSSLVYKVIKIYGNGSIYGTGMFRISTVEHKDSLLYRVGEVLVSGDTLWGGVARISFVNLQYHSNLSGDGTETSPHLISSYSDLEKVKEDLSAVYRLTANIDASTSITENSGAGFEPIGVSSSTPFTGIFHGDGYIIKNLHISRPAISYAGLFGCTGSGSIVDSLGLTDVTINGYSSVGGLVGGNSSVISNCYVTGNVSATSTVGGLVGNSSSYSSITNSYALGKVSGSVSVGGLVGAVTSSGISNCYAAVNVSGDSSYVGGLAGRIHFSTISNSYATGNVSGSSDYLGGLVGYNYYSTITNSYATGSVSDSWNSELYNEGMIGGLVGYNNYSTITKSYATGNVSDSSSSDTYVYIGGLVGINNSSTISNSHAAGTVFFSSSSSYASCIIGGLVGRNLYSTIANSFAIGNVSNLVSSCSYASSGGLVGFNGLFASISSSYATGNVSDSSSSNTNGYIGGLVGNNSLAAIDNSYSTGSVSGLSYYAGGLAGFATASSIANSYTIGSVSGANCIAGFVGCSYNGDTVKHCYWNTETTHWNYGFGRFGGGLFTDTVGLTTAQMKVQSNYTSWDFTGETVNGTSDLWAITSTINNGYPHLAWQDSAGNSTGLTEKDGENLPKTFNLNQNYPNPFNPTTTISFDIPKQYVVTLKVYDVLGREIATLVNEIKNAGSYKAVWNATRFASGVYFCRIQAGTYTNVKKLVLMK